MTPASRLVYTLARTGMLLAMATQTLVAGELQSCMLGMAAPAATTSGEMRDAGMATMMGADDLVGAPAADPPAPDPTVPACDANGQADDRQGCDRTDVPAQCTLMAACSAVAVMPVADPALTSVVLHVSPTPVNSRLPGSFRADPDSPPPRA